MDYIVHGAMITWVIILTIIQWKLEIDSMD